VLKTNPTRFPSFSDESATRDFGRNGSFLVIRQLAQDVERFKKFTEVRAEQLRMYNNLEEIAGAPIDAQWIAAKLMGRWQDGTPLVVQPGATTAQSPPKHAARYNDFSYGTDDPQGLHCPFGAHIRRANPRDSLDPDDPEQQAITNRHRLLRRGRTYDFESAGDENESKGLLFTCLCADLERQFEFIQQTWIRSPDFHGLQNEPDPMVSSQRLRTRVFTIPTPSGSLRLHDMESFVTVRGGGYFFLPSRSAIQYLADLNA
jgi:Dyp-type peroxidase family